MSRTYQDKMRYLALSIEKNPTDSSAVYLVMSSNILTLCEAMVMVLELDMDVAEAEEINPNQEIKMLTVSIVADSISLSSAQHLGRNVANATSWITLRTCAGVVKKINQSPDPEIN